MEGATSVWYPAEGGGETMRFRDYAEPLEQYEAVLHARRLTDEQIVEMFDRRVSARHEARPIVRDFQVVVLAPAKFLADQAERAEVLASGGCVVKMLRN